MSEAELTNVPPTALDDALNSLEAELARFRSPPVDPVVTPLPKPGADIVLPLGVDDDAPEEAAPHFLIAAYSAC